MKLLIATFLAVAAGGCVVHVHDQGYVHHAPPSGEVVVVEKVHVHSASCGHYWYDGRWYVHTGHIHAAGCGHYYHDGYWVLAAPVVVERAHVHSATCGHYYSGTTVYYMHNHRHGPGCGHHWDGRVWVSVRF